MTEQERDSPSGPEAKAPVKRTEAVGEASSGGGSQAGSMPPEPAQAAPAAAGARRAEPSAQQSEPSTEGTERAAQQSEPLTEDTERSAQQSEPSTEDTERSGPREQPEGETAPAAGEQVREATGQPPVAPVPQTEADTRRESSRSRSVLAVVALLIALIALGVSAFAAYWSMERARSIEEQAARRLQAADRGNQDLSSRLEAAQDTLRELQGRTTLMEAKLGETATQQAQLDRLLQDAARIRGDRQLADVEQAVLTAARQLEWNGNVRGALLALQEADAMLERMNLPASIGLRGLIEADIERVRGLDTADVAVWIRRLDGMLGTVNRLRLVADAAPADAAREAPGEAAASGSAAAGAAAGGQGADQAASGATSGAISPLGTWAQTGSAWWERLLRELGSLVRIHKVDRPDTLLLAPEQGFFARENLRLSLTSARLGVLARNEDWLRTDVARAMSLLDLFFDADHPPVASMLAQLRQLAVVRLDAAVPTLAETLAAVRSARTRGQAR